MCITIFAPGLRSAGCAATIAASCTIQLTRSCMPGCSGSSCSAPENVTLPAGRWKFAATVERRTRQSVNRTGAMPSASKPPLLIWVSSVIEPSLPSRRAS